ncbi:Response regulator receiver domain/Histidine kinase-like ATPase domain [Gulbenkiania indica]|uniref:Response regulator receiver domain/Histidine kinase-like ATPase domain n=2 Tax=Gulbenkiania TaxID=397456 RepID=A0A0K6H858_9NEIS|nr:response regulator [Gulbenkiania indica]TCW28457.1 histidine kinase-like protein [Gulbenkiania mobilis]CUA87171.1 Response regulator receiver domain/Histidine kinase-like ATPase domain [Gulbenkiania indica]
MAHTLLLVDDEPFNLELMSELLSESGFDVVAVESGEAALQALEQDGQHFSAVLLDKMMPGLSGFDVLRRIKADPTLAFLPVILQTAVGAAASVQEGLAAGAFYYLTKPFSRDMLLAVVEAAVSHWDRYLHFRELAHQQLDALRHLSHAEFAFRTHREAQSVTALLAQACPQPERVATGLFELIVNAIEHGNLGLSYHDKTRLQASGEWEQEVERRLADPAMGERRVRVRYEASTTLRRFWIEDEGEGFDWAPYQEIDPASLIESHGRGILIARRLSFDQLTYHGQGNQVEALVQVAG